MTSTVMTRLAWRLALPLACALAVPAAAQQFPSDPGEFWEVGAIELTDGGGTAYLEWLATEWKKEQEFAKSKGWIKGYKVLSNVNPREGEPDLYLITMFDDYPNAKTAITQRKAYFDWQSKTAAKLDEESGGRTKMRRILGSTLLQEQILK